MLTFKRLPIDVRPPYSYNALLHIYSSVSIIGFIYYGHFLYAHGYLPTPFVHDKSNTFMDLFNPMYWAEIDGRYEIWDSVYPPLNFLMLKIINYGLGSHFNGYSPLVLRDSSIKIIISLIGLYILTPLILLNMSAWKHMIQNTWQKILYYFTIVFSTPMLFALERGNLILICLLFLPLTIASNQILRLIGIALLINLKPYFIILISIYVFDRRYSELLACIITTSLIFLLSSVMLDIDPTAVWLNILQLSQKSNFFPIRELLSFPVTLSTLTSSVPLLFTPESFGSAGLRNFILDGIRFVTYLQYTCVVIIIIAFTAFQNRLTQQFKLFALIVIIINVAAMVGPYSLIYYIPFVPFIVYFKYAAYYLAGILLLCLPLDVFVLQEYDHGTQFVYLTQNELAISWQLGLGALVRPIINLLLLFVLTAESIKHSDFNLRLRLRLNR